MNTIKTKKVKYTFLNFTFILILLNVSCTEPYALLSNSYEEAIVIEATITNELKKQKIKISKTYRFEESGPTVESGAEVYITDSSGNRYDFEEIDGVYNSKVAFQAVPNIDYQLRVITKDGESFTSASETLTAINELESLTLNNTTLNGINGVEIIANSYDPNNNSTYYRYEYEETFTMIPPKWVNTVLEAKKDPNDPNDEGTLFLKKRVPFDQSRKCYRLNQSNQILLTNTSKLSEDRVEFPVRFISSSDYIITNRYSILVKQYVQNLASYTYYQTLKKFSSSENLLSQSQPGFISGNIQSDNNPNYKVNGYFEVSSFSEKRIFFNFTDVFPNEKAPKYPYLCPDIDGINMKAFDFVYSFGPGGDGPVIIDDIANKRRVFFEGYTKLGEVPKNEGVTLYLYTTECGDCDSFSSNIKPKFWID
jgi:hypothetical protein